jgi:hypothetical protein
LVVVDQLAPSRSRKEFDRCWPWLWKSLCEFGPTHNKQQVWARICGNKAFLFPFQNCVVLGEFIDHPIGFRSFNYWLQGGNLSELLTRHDEIEAWAQSWGCHRVMGRGRDGWLRAMEGDWHKGPTTRFKWLQQPPVSLQD